MTTNNMSNYSYGVDCFQEIPQVLKSYHVRSVALIGGERALASSADQVLEILEANGYEVTGQFIYGTDSTQSNIDKLVANPDVARADIIFGFGGGRALDTAKMVAHELGKDIMTFPTICSNCSSGTAIAVIYKDDHSLLKYGYPETPVHIFINTKVIAEAPVKYFWAGIGDGISKAPEVERAAYEYEQRGGVLSHTGVLGRAVALSSKDAFYEYGQEGLKDVENHKPSKAVEEIALAILVSTGYASNLVNQPDFYFNSCHAHAFYNGTTVVKREGEHLHGAVVSFGVMVLHAYFGETEELSKVAHFNKSLGLPVTLAEIGLAESDIAAVLNLALETNEYKHTPFETDRFTAAVLKANQVGQTLLSV